MGFDFKALKMSVMAGVLAAGFQGQAGAQTVPDDTALETPEAAQTLQNHTNMQSDPGIYARDLYLGYFHSNNPTIDTLTQTGLLTLAANAYSRSSIEPAGIVGLDIERDDLSLFPFIYWPVTDNMQRLSPEARQKIQDYTGQGGVLVVDLIGGTLRTSEATRLLLRDIQAAPLQTVEEGDVLTQSFYLVDALPGTADREVLVERTTPELESANVTSFIIGDQNWAMAWTGRSVGVDIHEDGLRSGLNMLTAALVGTYGLDDWRQPTLDQKRDYQAEAVARRAAEEAAPSQP